MFQYTIISFPYYMLFYFTDIMVYIYLCTFLCVYILLLLSCFGCCLSIILLRIIPSSFYANHTTYVKYGHTNGQCFSKTQSQKGYDFCKKWHPQRVRFVNQMLIHTHTHTHTHTYTYTHTHTYTHTYTHIHTHIQTHTHFWSKCVFSSPESSSFYCVYSGTPLGMTTTFNGLFFTTMIFHSLLSL